MEAHEDQASQKYNQVPPLEHVPMDGQVLIVSPHMMDGEIRTVITTRKYP